METKSPREILVRWSVATGCMAALLLVFSPSWGAFRLWSRVPEMQGLLEVRRGVSVLAQIEHPGAPIADPLHAAIQWRLLFPLIGRVTALPPVLFFSLAPLGCLLLLGTLVTLLRRRGLPWFECALGTLTLGASSWFFTSTGWLGYFDSWLALALVVVAFSERPWLVWFACLWAPWGDERFVVAAPLALLCRHLLARVDAAIPPSPAAAAPSFDLRRHLVVPAALIGAFLVVRLGVLASASAAGATPGGYLAAKNYLDAPVAHLVLGVWEGLRVSWVFVATAIVLLWAGHTSPPSRRAALWLGASVLALALAGLATAQDYSRSMTMVLPAAVLGLLLAAGRAASWLPRLLRLGTLAALLLPAHHVMSDRINPIFYLYHELAALRTPPRAAMPELFELRAIHEMERGEFAAAEADLTLAVKLATNPASPARQRGILLASRGRWSDALHDFSLAVEHDPDNPDAWFMRAQAQFALSRTVDARADLDRALSLAPAGWSTRPDVTRFMAKLNQPR